MVSKHISVHPTTSARLEKMIKDIASRWRQLSGQDNWKNLLDPLDLDLRQYLIHYAEMCQATYDCFNSEKVSKYSGSCRFSRKNLFDRVGLTIAHPFQYTPTKYVYATSTLRLPEAFILKSLSRERWCKESNWMGYIAVATDEGKVALGRRDIMVVWRGTLAALEWFEDFNFPLVSASTILGKAGRGKAHRGFLSIYTSADPQSRFNKTSARDQVICELNRLVEKYKDEEISITVTGHSLGASLATLCAADIGINGLNTPKDQTNKPCPVTAFVFASPRSVDYSFKRVIDSTKNLHIMRVHNVPDIVPLQPPFVEYVNVGEALLIDVGKSQYMRRPQNIKTSHNLEVYMHGIAGTQGSKGGFHLEVERDIALVNKMGKFLKEKYLVPSSWWRVRNKGMVQVEDGSWVLQDHEKDDDEDEKDDGTEVVE